MSKNLISFYFISVFPFYFLHNKFSSLIKDSLLLLFLYFVKQERKNIFAYRLEKSFVFISAINISKA